MLGICYSEDLDTSPLMLSNDVIILGTRALGEVTCPSICVQYGQNSPDAQSGFFSPLAMAPNLLELVPLIPIATFYSE